MNWWMNVFTFLSINIGLILNIIGTIFVACSFGPFPDKKAAPSTDGTYIAYFNYPKLFWAGIALLTIGFVLQVQL